MLDRFSVSALLKAVIAATALVVVAMFALNSWDSWSRWLSAGRIVKVNVPVTVGVPLSAPALVSVIPVGKAPAEIVNVYVPVPPVAVIVWL